MEENRFTPATIGQHQFSIPLYQRLFEWEEEQVNQLLQDLYASFKENEKAPYYIGVLTVYKSSTQDRYSLVDGQQRFTVLMLLSIVLGWEDFSLCNNELLCNNQLRLTFFARKNDEAYLKAIVEKSNPDKYTNAKMQVAIKAIDSFLKNQVDTNCLEEFKQFTKEKTTFFISVLPENYSSNELNRYFEAMNEAGKGLENHEILKVQLLKILKLEEDFNHCTKIWNEVSQMDKYLIQQKENESIQDYNKRNIEAFKNPSTVLESGAVTNSNIETSILSIEPTKEKPQDSSRVRDEGALIDFQEFLLIVLSLTLNKEISFDINKLLTTFEELVNLENEEYIKSFFENLLTFRVLFDYFIIRKTSLDGRTTTYTLNYTVEEDQSKQALIHYQSMLYVSTSYNIWLKPLLKQLEEKKGTQLNDFKFLVHLKSWDNKRHDLTNCNLNYGSINRYWFWRLDYYLWERREEFFKNKEKEIANHYLFRANRSIEHIAPQTPKDDSNVKLKDDVLDLFGNLAMISSGQNSSLQNASYEVKRAHIESFINGSVGGSIESLKLLKILEFETWNENNVKQHHNEMVNVLIDSFPENTVGRDFLEKLTIKDYA